MEKIKIIQLILVASFLILFFSKCTVNESTGLIQVTNYTSKTISDVSIGSWLIAINVQPGTTVDYWFFNEIEGRLTTTGSIPINDSQAYITWDLQTNYWISIFAKDFGNGTSIALTYSKNGSKDNEETLISN